MQRRTFMKTLGAGALALAGTPRLHAAPENKHPNIVIILADDMGFGDMACQNPDSKIPTPNLDRLASQGLRFTDGHSPSAVCTPTRYSLLTGRYCWRSRLKKHVLWPWDGPLIEPDRLTLPAMLKQHGYKTACIGKWHLGWDWPTADGTSVNDEIPLGKWNREVREPFGKRVDFTTPVGGGPTTRGFDYYFGDDVPNFPPYTWIENDRITKLPAEEKPKDMFGSPGPMAPDWELDAVMPRITAKAADYIKTHADDTPFFLYFPLTAPHTPIAPAEDFQGKSEAGRYGDFVYQVDWTVGEIMRALEESGQAENTLLIFTSDNGSPARDGENMAGQPESVLRYGHNPSHIYRGIKTDIWDGGHRVPFLARWPGRIPEGAVCDALAGLNDLMATCAAIVGHTLPQGAAEDSVSLLPLLEAPGEASPPRKSIVHHSYHGMFAIRTARWKYIEGKGGGGWKKPDSPPRFPGQLYDMQADPQETNNRYDAHPEIVRRLQTALEERRTPANSPIK